MFKNLKRIIQHVRYGEVEVDLSHYMEVLNRINEFNMKDLSENGLKEVSLRLIQQARGGMEPDLLLPEAFALVREACKRVLGLNPFDVQVIAGIAMYKGNIAEMQTGEGKTLTAVFPAYLNAIAGKGVHILTFNDYLAKRDALWMGPVYTYLGLTVGYVNEKMSPEYRKKAYLCDITYVTARESGFDFLRDSLCFNNSQLVQRPFNCAIVDEADSLMVDEARVPLVLAGKEDEQQNIPEIMNYVVQQMIEGKDFDIDEYERNVHMTDKGLEKAELILNCGNLYDASNIWLLSALNCALHASVLIKKDRDYIVRNNKIEIVDEFTGRVADKRHWPDGLQAAVEAKEGIKSDQRGRVLNSVTMQDFISIYPKICGMTGTAKSAAEELKEFYGVYTVIIPTNKPCIRIDHKDLIFTHNEAKLKALVKEIISVNKTGRPILIGTSSVIESEWLADELNKEGIICSVLNAKNDELEAEIIAQAGRLGIVTVSTNMAGRGTDIKLGGENEEQREEVVRLGGLYVIGTNRNESLRIDNQLRGRSGRQGDPGSTRFFTSLEDDLMIRYKLKDIIPEKYYPKHQDRQITNKIIINRIICAQKIIEGQNFDIRRNLYKYSSITELQRKSVHNIRLGLLNGTRELDILKRQSAERYNELTARFGPAVVKNAESQLFMFFLSKYWSDFLDYAAYIKEGIHLVSIGGANPLYEFNAKVSAAFEEMKIKIISSTVNTFNKAHIDENGINMDKEGLKAPSSTWTYVVDDTAQQFGMLGLLGNAVAYAANPFLIPALIITGIINRFSKKKNNID